MSDVSFEFEWEDPRGAKGADLRATWAALTITIDGQIVTDVRDYVTKGFRSRIYLPLYPLAEWIAASWWPLLYEVEVPGRSVERTYLRRHSLRAAREGFALPDLRIVPQGQHVRLDWMETDLPACRVKFLSE